MQASTSQVESYAGFSISHPVPDFKAVRSLKIPNYEFLNKPCPRLQRCERVWEGPCNYECPMNGRLLWSWEFHILDLAKWLKSVETTFWKSFFMWKVILEVISGLKIFQKRFSIISWIECTNARRCLLVDLMKPLKGLWCRVSWSPNSTVLHLDIYLHKYTNLKDTAGQSASAVYNCTMRRIANSAQYTKCRGGLLR